MCRGHDRDVVNLCRLPCGWLLAGTTTSVALNPAKTVDKLYHAMMVLEVARAGAQATSAESSRGRC